MNPVCGNAVTCEKPESVVFLAPRSKILHAGIFDNFVKPPATPAEMN